MRLPAWTYLVVFVLGIGLCWWLMRGCEKPGPDHSTDKAFADSLNRKAHNDSIAVAKAFLTITDSLREEQKKNDELHAQQQRQEQVVNKAGGQILGLVHRIDSLKAKNDVLGQLVGCDSLRNLYEDAAKIVGGYEYISDSLIDKLKSERKLSDSVKNYLYSVFSQSNTDLFEISRKYNNLYSDYKKLNVKPKRWGIGPSAGAFITNKGAGYGVGITISYSIIKF